MENFWCVVWFNRDIEPKARPAVSRSVGRHDQYPVVHQLSLGYRAKAFPDKISPFTSLYLLGKHCICSSLLLTLSMYPLCTFLVLCSIDRLLYHKLPPQRSINCYCTFRLSLLLYTWRAVSREFNNYIPGQPHDEPIDILL